MMATQSCKSWKYQVPAIRLFHVGNGNILMKSMGKLPLTKSPSRPSTSASNYLKKIKTCSKGQWHIKKGCSLLHPGKQQPQLIVRLKKAHPQFLVAELCRVFGINESTYYYSVIQTAVPASKKVLDDIAGIVEMTDNTYGRRRMHVKLNKLGYDIGIYNTAALMKEANVTARTPKKTPLLS